MEIFKLFGSIFVNTDDADKSMQKTEKNAEGIAAKLGKGVSTAAKWGAAVVSGATIAGSAMIGMANNAASTADTVDKASIRMGVSAEYYQELAYAAGQCGVETNALEKAAKKLEGTDLNMEAAMNQIMSFETAEERAAAAAELFGDSVAYTLSPLIEQSGESFDELINRADELGIVMSDDAVAAGVKLGDTISDIKQSFTAMGTSLGTAVIPMIQTIADIIVTNLPMIQEMIGQLAPLFAATAETLLPPLVSLAQNLLPIIINLFSQLIPVIGEMTQAVLPAISSLLELLLPPLMEIIEALLPPLLEVIQAITPILTLIVKLLSPIIELATALIIPLVELVAGAITPLITVLEQLIQSCLEPMIPIIETVADVLETVLGQAFQDLKPIIDNIVQVFSGLITFITGIFTGDWKKAWQGVVDIFKGIFSGIFNIVKLPLNQIIKGINSVFSSLGNIKIPDWVPMIGGQSFSLPQIPMLYKGGNIVEDGQVLVGEKGPEVLNLPRGAKVTPLSYNTDSLDGKYDRILELLMMILQAVKDLDIDIIIPVNVMGDQYDEVVVSAAQRHAYKTGGR